MILAGDVGATKVQLEAGDFRDGAWQPVLSRRYAIVDYANPSEVIAAFLEELRGVDRRAKPSHAAFGIAGPVVGNKGKMTHRPWAFDGDALAERFGMKRMRIVNDLAAAARGIEALGPRDTLVVQAGRAASDAPRVVLGVGTGLGIAYLVPGASGGFNVVPGEGGHIGFSPSSPEQAQLWQALFRKRGRVEAEDIVSGRGMTQVYEVLRGQGEVHGDAPAPAEPAWIVDGAVGRGDATCRHTLDLFIECMGTVAGDHALACMARGGVYIAGGVAAKIAPLIRSARFVQAFCAKGVFGNFMAKVPVRVVTSERLPVVGAAMWARSG